jgi:hypothetical protein
LKLYKFLSWVKLPRRREGRGEDGAGNSAVGELPAMATWRERKTQSVSVWIDCKGISQLCPLTDEASDMHGGPYDLWPMSQKQDGLRVWETDFFPVSQDVQHWGPQTNMQHFTSYICISVCIRKIDLTHKIYNLAKHLDTSLASQLLGRLSGRIAWAQEFKASLGNIERLS